MIDNPRIDSYLVGGKPAHDSTRTSEAIVDNVKIISYLQYGLATINEMAEWIVRCRAQRIPTSPPLYRLKRGERTFYVTQ